MCHSCVEMAGKEAEIAPKQPSGQQSAGPPRSTRARRGPARRALAKSAIVMINVRRIQARIKARIENRIAKP
jgi:hypothetical protein